MISSLIKISWTSAGMRNIGSEESRLGGMHPMHSWKIAMFIACSFNVCDRDINASITEKFKYMNTFFMVSSCTEK